ncbi:MAG: alpha/beta fold hydrolase, partial [Dolichospermum sp.]
MNYSRLRNSLGATTPGKSIEVDGINLTYNDEGEGLTIICLHAIGHGAADFQKLQTNLVHNYRVIAIDFPSHGNSDDDYQPVSLQRYTDVLTLFIDQLKLDRFVLIGNS